MKKLLCLLLVAMLFTVSCAKDEPPVIPKYSVKYEVISNPAGFDITYKNVDGDTIRKSISSTEWTTTFEALHGQLVYISAKANNTGATITSTIYSENKVFKSSTSVGDYVTATASGSLP